MNILHLADAIRRNHLHDVIFAQRCWEARILSVQWRKSRTLNLN